MGKTIEIKEVPNKNGSGTYTAYVKFDFDKMQPRSYRNNPDLKQAINPSEWEIANSQEMPADEKHAYPYTFVTYTRRRIENREPSDK